ncbi:uncharacterized protein LOC111323928 [Stylophora pistillata]|uniref:Receptor-interacting serine/threonine-protein kinase 1 n=1 Tax=Stylophora pistillata TaxID=50429 RepID=A0A2B4T1Y4_STYPI|nr:uncharacterized protein LOC111323928 [Stylophora pistillata]PFX34635.1 Receptor-interacting serine/threonine-protein kinase 1 [Stylophora pistillata]
MAQNEDCRFVSLDPIHPLTEPDIHDQQLPEGIGMRWKDLARKLGFKESLIEVIHSENDSCNDRCIKLLVRWMEKEGHQGATAGKLAAALKATGLQSLADRLIGPSGRRAMLIEIQGTLILNDKNKTEIILGVDSTEKRPFFMWKSPDKEFKTSVEELKSYIDATCKITAQKPGVIDKNIGTSFASKTRKGSLTKEQISTQTPEGIEEIIGRSIKDKGRKEISTQTPDTLEEVIATSAEKWQKDSSIKVHPSTRTTKAEEEFRTSNEKKLEESPTKEQISMQTPEVMEENIGRLIEYECSKEIFTQRPNTPEEIIGTSAQIRRQDQPIKAQIWSQESEVGEEYRTLYETKVEDSSDKRPVFPGKSAEFKINDSSHKESISPQTSEVEKEIIETSAEEKRPDDSGLTVQIYTHTSEVVEEIIRTPAEEMEQISTQVPKVVEENRRTGEEKVENSSSKAPKISEKLKDMQEKLLVVEKNLKIPELKGEAFHVTKKLDLISRHNTTLRELYTQMTGMTREACKCDESLKAKFYEFTYRNLRTVHDNLKTSVADLQSEKGNMTAAEKKQLDVLIVSRNCREKQIIYLDKMLRRLFPSADELKKSQPSPRGKENRKISGDSKNRSRKRKPKSRAVCVLSS